MNIIIILLISIQQIVCSDITNLVFGPKTDGIPAAFGDFNSDELTDVFMIRDKGTVVEILLGSDVEPLLVQGPKCAFQNFVITSVVPGDFDGDAFMDVMVTAKEKSSSKLNVYIHWGASDRLNCSSEDRPLIIGLEGEPLALDYNKDMIIDLFGLQNGKRTFFIFKSNRTQHDTILMPSIDTNEPAKLRIPHSHAYLDLNQDFTADLFIVTEKNFEIWYGREEEGFDYDHSIELPTGNDNLINGQTIFIDLQLEGVMNEVMPTCFDRKCENSTILMRYHGRFHDIQVNFKDMDNVQWGFVVPEKDEIYTNAITLRGGDFNMDGYPDLLVTLKKLTGGQPQTFLLENVPCVRSCGALRRTFVVRWKALMPFTNGTMMGAFYDFYQDGILDVILVEKKNDNNYRAVAFKNALDYDANFVKVIVLTGLSNNKTTKKLSPLGRKKSTYGTNLPGPRIQYVTTTQDGSPQHGASSQLPQSAYFSLHLPYTIFGLGRTPNFVDSLTVGLSNHSRIWTQLIPNSQMIVVPVPIDHPSQWKAKLFVTPSKLILMSVLVLGATCIIITFIIFGLYIKEKREDKMEKLAEAHRFHFDAM